MSYPWVVTDREWKHLASMLARSSNAAGAGRRRLDNTREAAEACLYRHFRSHGTRSRAFGWNELPDHFGVTPSTANRRYREWLESGAWQQFWDALHRLRARPKRDESPRGGSGGSYPAGDIVAELERAYRFFNGRFYGGTLPAQVAILLGPALRSRGGYFCARMWHRGDLEAGQIVICTSVLTGRPEPALETLLHEMVHLRNHQVGLGDCDTRNHYHNRHFRDVAVLFGLRCLERQANRGYGYTELDERGREAIRVLKPDPRLFKWKVGPGS
jgi:hypothetical protein